MLAQPIKAYAFVQFLVNPWTVSLLGLALTACGITFSTVQQQDNAIAQIHALLPTNTKGLLGSFPMMTAGAVCDVSSLLWDQIVNVVYPFYAGYAVGGPQPNVVFSLDSLLSTGFIAQGVLSLPEINSWHNDFIPFVTESGISVSRAQSIYDVTKDTYTFCFLNNVILTVDFLHSAPGYKSLKMGVMTYTGTFLKWSSSIPVFCIGLTIGSTPGATDYYAVNGEVSSDGSYKTGFYSNDFGGGLITSVYNAATFLTTYTIGGSSVFFGANGHLPSDANPTLDGKVQNVQNFGSLVYELLLTADIASIPFTKTTVTEIPLALSGSTSIPINVPATRTAGLVFTPANVIAKPGTIAIPIVPVVPVAGYPDLSIPQIIFMQKFPFCLPWDIYNTFFGLAAAPEAPVIVLPFPLSKVGLHDEVVTIDFTQYGILAAIVRWGLSIVFVLGLILISRKIIGAGGG